MKKNFCCDSFDVALNCHLGGGSYGINTRPGMPEEPLEEYYYLGYVLCDIEFCPYCGVKI